MCLFSHAMAQIIFKYEKGASFFQPYTIIEFDPMSGTLINMKLSPP